MIASTPPVSKLHNTTSLMECVEIPSRAVQSTSKKSLIDIAGLTEDLGDLIIAASPSEPSRQASPSISPSLGSIDKLISSCSLSEICAFDDFLRSPALLNLLPSRAQPSFAKIGEASYSEVFSIKRGKFDLIIKVVPLLPACSSSLLSQTDIEVPDCSSPDEVLREVEITKTMSRLKGGGFVDFKG